MKISLTLFFIFSNIIALFAQQSPEKQGLNALFQRDLPKAEQLFQDLLKANKNNLIANYGLSHVYFEQQQTLKQKQQYQIKYLNFEPHFSLLRKAYFHAIIASDLFKQLPENEKEKMKKIANVTADAIQLQQRNKIPQEAYSLLTNAPYRLSYQKLYESNIYNRYTEADTLISLRENLLQQCADFAKDYPTSPFLKNVKEYCREMLKDYINLLSLRQFGDRSGSIYEKFCDLAITDFDSAELKHVVPSFYGAYFGFTPKNYSSNPNYLKLQTFANNYKLSVIQLLCELNLHHLGYRESKAQLYDAFIRTFAPVDIALVAVKKMASPHLSTQNWESAISVFEKYKPLFSKQAKNFNFDKMIALLSEAEGERKLVNLGKEINSEAKEYSPVLSLDGTTLYFARKGANTGEDIYFSECKEGKWQPSFPLSQRVNTNTHEVPLMISPDGNTLYIYGNYAELPDFFYTKEKFLGKGDLYFVEKKGVTNGQITWDKMQVLPEPINSPHYEAGLSIATNGKAILFGSDRSGNIGGYLPNYHPDFLYYHGAGEFNIDIYVCEKTENGWSAPINLGETINTPFAEMNPCLHPDGKTLYFCSDGHYGLGGYDIFMSKRLDENSWTKWSEPVNLGKVINTAYNDNFFITADGATALIANTKKNDNYGLSDIYSIEVPQSKRPEPVKLIRGKITNVENKAISTAIKWQEISNSKNSGAAKSDEKGDFILLLNGGKKYVYFTDDEQIFGSSIEIDLSGKDWKSTKFEMDIVVGTIDKNKPINLPFTLPTLHFDYNKDIIRNESFFDLDRLVALLQKNTSIKLSIEGHTDSDGNDAFNLALSERRAEAVKKYLLSKNCKNTIMAEGFGKSKAKTSNETEKGKQQNRRVEFRVSF